MASIRKKIPGIPRIFRNPDKMTDETTKRCSNCGQYLPLSEFYKRKTFKDGLDYWCKSCYREYNKIRYETHQSDMLSHTRKYRNCVTKPSCTRVGGRGAQFELFVCEICGTEFRRRKTAVDYDYEHRGYLPRFCSRECRVESMRKSHKSKYEKEIERIKKEI